MSILQNLRNNPEKAFRYFLIVSYSVGALLHLLDVFDFRLEFSSMALYWKIWILFLLVGDTLTAGFLLKKPKVGIIFFHAIALTQLAAYTTYENYFGRQSFLVVFHILCLLMYWKIFAYQKRTALKK